MENVSSLLDLCDLCEINILYTNSVYIVNERINTTATYREWGQSFAKKKPNTHKNKKI